MAQPGFELLFENLDSIGFFDFVLPLLLFMAVFFGILRKTEVIGDDEAVQGVASISLAFLTTFGIYIFIPASFLPQFFGALSVIIVLILGLLILAGMMGYEVGGGMEERSQNLVIAGVVFLVLMFLPVAFNMSDFNYQLSEQYSTFILTIVMIVGIVYVLSELGE